MKVTLDLDKLLEDKRITRDEYARFATLAARDTASLGLNILVAFGVIAVATATIALLRSASAATALGAAIAAAGLWADHGSREKWQPLGTLLLLVGCLMAGGGLVSLTEGSPASFIALALVFAAVSLMARSGLLHHRSGVRGDPLLYAVLRAPRRHAGLHPRGRPDCLGDRVRPDSLQSDRAVPGGGLVTFSRS